MAECAYPAVFVSSRVRRTMFLACCFGGQDADPLRAHDEDRTPLRNPRFHRPLIASVLVSPPARQRSWP